MSLLEVFESLIWASFCVWWGFISRLVSICCLRLNNHLFFCLWTDRYEFIFIFTCEKTQSVFSLEKNCNIIVYQEKCSQLQEKLSLLNKEQFRKCVKSMENIQYFFTSVLVQRLFLVLLFFSADTFLQAIYEVLLTNGIDCHL